MDPSRPSAGDAGRPGGFGTAPVFLTAISTILGAIMFLRFGYAVGSLGFLGALAVIALGHLVTIPTAMAVAEIATNQRVAGGGEYYIISRSFGITIGAAIGVALYLSQAISVAFYVIAFGEAFGPLIDWLAEVYGIVISDRRMVSLPAMAILAVLMLTRGADVGVKALWVVVTVLFASLVAFFAGEPYGEPGLSVLREFQGEGSFFAVFAICFPAFTGMTAGVGLSGDLARPERSIPIGTLAATISGMLIYVAIAYKLAMSAPQADLIGDQLVMAKIAVWGPIIPIGLACATFSSALGSILVAPRTLQALAHDGIMPTARTNRWLARGRGERGEPVNASLITVVIAFGFIAVGDVNMVAEIISMFFLVSYGSICLISFLEHFAADPAYRPAFRSRWYVSMLGATMCVVLMFQTNIGYAALALFVMTLLYVGISRSNPHLRGVAGLFEGALFQISRILQVFVQKVRSGERAPRWRPSVLCISGASFERVAAFDLVRWVTQRYGFGTYIHYIEGYLSRATAASARDAMARLVKRAQMSHSNVFVDTVVSPSYTSAIANSLQLPGVSGQENNMLMLEFDRENPAGLDRIVDNYQLAASIDFDVCILSTAPRGYGYEHEIHIWITQHDYENASLMILLGYILLGHEDWRGGMIKILALFPETELDQRRDELHDLVKAGRLPISMQNIEVMAASAETSRQSIIVNKSRDADLIIVGFQGEALKHDRDAVFAGYEGLGNVIFVDSRSDKGIV
ncbi:amino acid permease [Haliangium sp.]|uniref:amino acid permease n=1 Tax=Haliangium sp. TaxID=2663208 RepID=UPI003D128C1F